MRISADKLDAKQYYGMVWRGIPAGIGAYAVVFLPPHLGIDLGRLGIATAVYTVLALAVLLGWRRSRGRSVTNGELILQNLLSNGAIVLGVWTVGGAQGSLLPLFLVAALCLGAFSGGWFAVYSWTTATLGFVVSSLMMGDSPMVVVASALVFACCIAAAQLSVSFIQDQLRAVTRHMALERELAGYAASQARSGDAFRLMLPPAQERLQVRTVGLVATDGEHPHVVAASRDGVVTDLPLEELDLTQARDLGALNDLETLMLVTGVGEERDATTLQAVCDLISPVVERARHLDALERTARSDALTGLANRRHLTEVLSGLEDGANSFAAVILDLDWFKELNDSQGHLAGDEVLVRAADVIRRVARTDDVTVRYGGEEFCIILPGADLAQARAIEERLREAWRAAQLPVTFSAGVAAARAGDRVDDVLRRADEALYAAKAAGRDRTITVAPA